MGNTITNNASTDNNGSILDQIYGRPMQSNGVHVYRKEAARIISELSKKPSVTTESSDIDLLTNVFVDRYGKNMPYSTFPSFHIDTTSESDYDMASPEKMRYIEIVLCHEDGTKENEKYAIHNKPPDHDCGANCQCILQTFEIQGHNYRRIPNMKQFGSRMGGQYGGMSVSSPSPFGSSDEDMDVDSSTSAESDSSDYVKHLHKMRGGYDVDKKKKKSKDEMTSDEENDDAVDGDLEIDPEEEGIMLNYGSISTEDLYKMQQRIFGSATPGDLDYEKSEELGLTEEVEQAMHAIDKKRQTFDTEESDILNMTPKLKKPKFNLKYI